MGERFGKELYGNPEAGPRRADSGSDTLFGVRTRAGQSPLPDRLLRSLQQRWLAKTLRRA
jgi:hypothetical protein